LLEDDVDENGDLLPPRLNTMNVNLMGCIYTVKLGIHYLKKNPAGGSIVMTASASSFTRLPTTDYSTFLPSPFSPQEHTSDPRHSNIQTRRPRPPPLPNPTTPPQHPHSHQRHRALVDRHSHCAARHHRRAGRGELPGSGRRGAQCGLLDGAAGEAWAVGV
jgi:NAD(P)-dependent dehydrogenase (short-subunit alcohol dehydrogenase family)